MANILKILFLIILAFSISCEENGFIVKCPDCTEEEPLKTDLYVKLDGTSFGNETLITVYEGNIEDNIIYDSFKTFQNNTSVDVTINKKYTVTATYNKADKSIVAVDSATPKTKYNKDQCDTPCYFVYDRVLDLRVKYTK